jgi:hypothetical protein
MGRRGDGYGSEHHLHFHRGQTTKASELDENILREIGMSRQATLDWVYPPTTASPSAREPRAITFVKNSAIQTKWRSFWPQTGTSLTWDAIACVRAPAKEDEWLLFEAKANHPEFCGTPCGASKDGGRKQIERALNLTKRHLGVHHRFCWLGSYYQHANRLACLHFLTNESVPARLIELYFCGDVFPDGCPCPPDERAWRDLIRARDLTLGLPERHELSSRLHKIFLRAVSDRRTAS